ncbi:MAG: FAD-dependent monooxygenase [Acidimicrobiales bacterium]
MTYDVILAEVARLLGERTGCDPSLIRGTEWVTSFRIHRRLAEMYRQGRILLAGDAAHVHSPFGGQGMNTGIGDARNLAWKLAMVLHGTAEPELLDSNEAERRPVAAKALVDRRGEQPRPRQPRRGPAAAGPGHRLAHEQGVDSNGASGRTCRS